MLIPSQLVKQHSYSGTSTKNGNNDGVNGVSTRIKLAIDCSPDEYTKIPDSLLKNTQIQITPRPTIS